MAQPLYTVEEAEENLILKAIPPKLRSFLLNKNHLIDYIDNIKNHRAEEDFNNFFIIKDEINLIASAFGWGETDQDDWDKLNQEWISLIENEDKEEEDPFININLAIEENNFAASPATLTSSERTVSATSDALTAANPYEFNHNPINPYNYNISSGDNFGSTHLEQTPIITQLKDSFTSLADRTSHLEALSFSNYQNLSTNPDIIDLKDEIIQIKSQIHGITEAIGILAQLLEGDIPKKKKKEKT